MDGDLLFHRARNGDASAIAGHAGSPRAHFRVAASQRCEADRLFQDTCEPGCGIGDKARNLNVWSIFQSFCRWCSLSGTNPHSLNASFQKRLDGLRYWSAITSSLLSIMLQMMGANRYSSISPETMAFLICRYMRSQRKWTRIQQLGLALKTLWRFYRGDRSSNGGYCLLAGHA